MKLGEEVIAGMVLDYKDKFDTTQQIPTKNRQTYEINSLNWNLTKIERKCWANVQYYRRECMETLGIPGSISHNNLGSSFVLYSVKAMLTLALSISKLVIV